jgi:hypothetical protein
MTSPGMATPPPGGHRVTVERAPESERNDNWRRISLAQHIFGSR